MDIQLIEIDLPELEFGGVGTFSDPKIGLREAGPFDTRFGSAQLKEVRIGLVGTSQMVDKGKKWLERCSELIPTTMTNVGQYPNYDGFKSIFRADLVVNSIWVHEIEEKELNEALNTKDDTERFEDVLNLYSQGINKVINIETNKPNIILCCIPEIVIDSCHHVERVLTKKEKLLAKKKIATSNHQYDLFDQPEREDAETLLYRDFRRALKAKAILSNIPIQLGRDKLFLDLPDNQDAATRAWNSSVAMYYKAGGIPWRAKSASIGTCYTGITFHHLRTNRRAIVKSCLAQAFSSDGEGFALRGGDVEQDSSKNERTVHLSEEQSYNLGKEIIREYRERTGVNPQRIVLHKTSMFNEAEEMGFRSAFDSIPIIELINLLPTNFMLLKQSKYPVNRGSICIVNNYSYYFFNTGFIKEIGTYPGPHIPRPIEIRSNEPIDIERVSSDILSLARMNWNTASITSGIPVTVAFSTKIGGIMSELNMGNTDSVPTSFRFYI